MAQLEAKSDFFDLYLLYNTVSQVGQINAQVGPFQFQGNIYGGSIIDFNALYASGEASVWVNYDKARQMVDGGISWDDALLTYKSLPDATSMALGFDNDFVILDQQISMLSSVGVVAGNGQVNSVLSAQLATTVDLGLLGTTTVTATGQLTNGADPTGSILLTPPTTRKP